MNTRRIRHNWKLVVAIIVLAVGPKGISAQDKPESKVEILKPKANHILSGRIDVRLKLPAELSEPVYVGLGGPPWLMLKKVTDSNEWQGQLNSKMVPNGDQRLIVKTTSKRADNVISIIVKNPLKIYFSDLHSHTGFSDGTLIPAVAHDHARRVSRLDVFVLTDHLEQVDETEWLDMRETAWDSSEDGKFVSIPGLEWTKKVGHINIFDPQTNRWPADLEAFYKAAAEAGVVCKFNHPGSGEKAFGGLVYSEIGDQALQLMEVRRDNEEKAFIHALKQGWHIAPDGSDDTHGPTWGSRFAWSGILAPGLSKRNILDALKKRRCYSTLDRNCTLRFRVNDAPMGEILSEPVENVRVSVTVNDPDEVDRISRIELFEDGTIIQTDEPNSNHRRWKTIFRPQPGNHYYFVKVIQEDANVMWSAPVWVTVRGS